MTEELNVRLDGAFRLAANHRDQREDWRKQAQTDPSGTAVRVREAVAAAMVRERAESGELYGIDVSDLGSARDYDPRTLAEASDIAQRVNHYRILLWAQQELDSCATDESLSEGERAKKMCEVALEAWQALDGLLAHTLRQIRLHAAPREAKTLAEHAEAAHLAGQLATRTSLYWNVRLRKALDDIREHHERPRRERLEALLRELYANGPQVWDEHHETDWQLRGTRSETAKKIVEQADRLSMEAHHLSMEQVDRLSMEQASPLSMEQELAQFADRAKLLLLAKQAGLTPRQDELFSLVVGEPERYLKKDGKLNSKEAAREMGLAASTVRTLWAQARERVADTLAA
jgi:hypothetical protein